MPRTKSKPDWTLVPATEEDIDALRKKCRSRVARHAAVSAGAAMVPLPGVDIAVDVVLLAKLIGEIHSEFGLTDEQIGRFLPNEAARVLPGLLGGGGMLAVQSVMRALLVQLLKRAGVEVVAERALKLMPFARQIASAAFSFAAFRAVAYQHIEECAEVAEEAINMRTSPMH
ncbi:hypothetical protein [Noviherbaspirillum sp.]|uniref:hypothetical protein n=1 Tax=Noviherbaspirillum sp. TaxID=1926288 RepID=UPI002B4975F1|nr:hypothetical protein [Noviherbaspirillum sp.]HJV82453.1 hypothetical protein [Noviherbaspirillum sp.]